MKVRKAVIPVAGFGTRFLPATKSIPKGMIPVVDKPIIHYIVESVVASGITEIVLVTSANCQPIEDYFDRSPELERALEKSGKIELLEEVRRIGNMADIAYVRQKEPLGNGHAILMTRPAIGNEPFVMLWGDDILLGNPPVPRQLIDVAERHEGPVVGVLRVGPQDVEKYGIVEVEPVAGEPVDGPITRARSVTEKPSRDEARSSLAQVAFVLTPDIFDLLAGARPGPTGEIFLADSLDRLMKARPVYALEFSGKRYDAGDKLDFLRATVELALGHPRLGSEFREFLAHLPLASAASAR